MRMWNSMTYQESENEMKRGLTPRHVIKLFIQGVFTTCIFLFISTPFTHTIPSVSSMNFHSSFHHSSLGKWIQGESDERRRSHARLPHKMNTEIRDLQKATEGQLSSHPFSVPHTSISIFSHSFRNHYQTRRDVWGEWMWLKISSKETGRRERLLIFGKMETHDFLFPLRQFTRGKSWEIFLPQDKLLEEVKERLERKEVKCVFKISLLKRWEMSCCLKLLF